MASCIRLKHKLRTHRSVPKGLRTVFIISCAVALWILVTYHRAKHGGTSVKSTKLPPAAEPMSDDKTERYFTHKLWWFAEGVAERVYFYHHFLNSSWTAQATNLEHWRSELIDSMGNVSMERDFILTRGNVAENQSLVYYIQKKTKRGREKRYKATRHFIDQLPKVSPFENKRFKRCNVIGNSGLLLGSRCGKEIDEGDFIFRCNTAPLAPHKSDAGRKSNLTTMNPSIFEQRFNLLKTDENITSFLKMASQYNGYIWLSCFGVDWRHRVCLKALDVYSSTEPHLIVGHPDHFRSVWDFWKNRKFRKSRLSTGFYLIHIALSVCDETHLYGFWPFSSQLDFTPGVVHRVPYHYFDNMNFTTTHDMNHEFIILMQMHKLGLLRMHVGKCS